MPLVSVIIPTYHRPEHVVRAVGDALAQTVDDLEVVVVVDGLDEATVKTLGAIEDPRLNVLVPPKNLGNAGARNFGIAAAQGEWIALLDDDDQWVPHKLETQLAAARQATCPLPIVSCRLIARSEEFEFSWPRRLPAPGQPLSEYMFCRQRPGTGEGMVHTSTILAPKALFDAVPFDDDLPRYVDLDWLLRAAQVEGMEVIFAGGDEALSVWSIDEGRSRISNSSGWHWDVQWAEERRELLTPRAHAAYLLTMASIRARRAEDKSAFWPLLQKAARTGRFSPAELAFHVGNHILSAEVRDRLTARRLVRPAT